MFGGFPPEPAIERQIDRVLASARFTKSEKASLLFAVLVTGTLDSNPPNEYDLGRQFSNLPSNWKKDDATVRMDIKRLNKRLTEYYENEGADDPIIISIVRRAAAFKFNHGSPMLRTSSQATSNPIFFETLEEYFNVLGNGGLKCIVTGEPAVWHHLDGDVDNNALGNFIPLSPALHLHIETARRTGSEITMRELQPRYLAEDLARRHFANWNMAGAYGCAHLAFYMGARPLGTEIPDVRLVRLGDTMSHLRHRFNESIMSHVIRHSLLPVVFRMDSIDPRALCNIALQLSGILDESGYFATATVALAIIEDLAVRFPPLIFRPDSVNAFSILRRQLQLLAECSPHDKNFFELAKKAAEQASVSANLPLTLEVVKVSRYLRVGTTEAAQEAYDLLLPLASRFKNILFVERGIHKPRSIDFSNLAPILIFCGLAESRVQPAKWQDSAVDLIGKGKRLFHLTGYRLPPEFWATASNAIYKDKPRAMNVSFLSRRYLISRLREDARIDIESALLFMKRLRLVEKSDESLMWTSPWSPYPGTEYDL